jgi:hypothetical protein
VLEQTSVASARAEIVVEGINLSEKVSEHFQQQTFFLPSKALATKG